MSFDQSASSSKIKKIFLTYKFQSIPKIDLKNLHCTARSSVADTLGANKNMKR